ncbi:MAG: universal stress protein [Trueperaceae bacterium]
MRILHPTDFSQPAQKALTLARDIRERSGGTLHVVHAQRRTEIDRPSSRPQLDTFNPELLNQLAEQRSSEVDRLLGMLSHLASPDGTYELLWGNPVEELLAIQQRYDLVVMGAHGANRFDRHFLGGVAGRFVRRSSTPTISVREESAVTRVKRVMVATDFGAASLGAWEFARKFADLGAELVLAHVVEGDRGNKELDGDEVNERLSNLSAGTAKRIVVREGEPVVILPQLAQELGADLVAIGLRHHRAAIGLLLGNRADALLRSSAVPILTVPLLVD